MTIEALPDDLLSRVLECLGLQEAWRSARLVNMRFRDAVDGVCWRTVDLATGSPHVLKALSAMLRAGAMRLAPGAAVAVAFPLELVEAQVQQAMARQLIGDCDLQREPQPGDAERSMRATAVTVATGVSTHWVLAEAVCGLFEACGASLGSARTKLLLMQTHSMRDAALNVLRSLRGAASLSHLRLHTTGFRFRADEDELRDALAPLASLRSLHLEGSWLLDSPSAAAVAQRLPSLAALHARLEDGPALAALAPLAALADLHVSDVAGSGAPEALAALARGPAGRALASLHFPLCEDAFGPGALRALASLSSLERLEIGLRVDSAASHADFASLGRLARLRRLSLEARGELAPLQMEGLAEALCALAGLEELELRVAAGPDPAPLIRLLAAARPALCHAGLDLPAPPGAPVAAALAACARLRTARLLFAAGVEGVERLAPLARLGAGLCLRFDDELPAEARKRLCERFPGAAVEA